MLIFLSKFIDKMQEKINNISILMLTCISTIIPFILIKEEPSLSAGLVLLAILVTELFVGGLRFKYIEIALIVVIVAAVIFYVDLLTPEHKLLSTFLEPYHIKRLLSAINPDPASADYYQTKNSIWAIGSGQLSGKGLFNGTINQLSYLPYSHNDFIFSVVGEEFGFLGCVGVLAVMLVIIFRCIKTAWCCEDNFGRLLAAGVAGMFTFQTFTNVGVATGLLPNTGMPFPFLSYGGSSMWVNMLSVGLVLNIGINRQKSMF
jgi:rod shape determining protein RodA